ncbi:hypothetical protein M8C13_18060 [Crossiella sp. SN42]|uniref:hypothetical protein n=1 Tax=Crossiella sp. SN42 TaxID=2944808 RepID=UPI00207D2503|nr:hypothetical protein [Crossiella sp. SN42]MCO1577664.1 hypothetical protein [Crossiella sp. SN42]
MFSERTAVSAGCWLLFAVLSASLLAPTLAPLLGLGFLLLLCAGASRARKVR